MTRGPRSPLRGAGVLYLTGNTDFRAAARRILGPKAGHALGAEDYDALARRLVEALVLAVSIEREACYSVVVSAAVTARGSKTEMGAFAVLEAVARTIRARSGQSQPLG